MQSNTIYSDYFTFYNKLMSKIRYDLECKIDGCKNPVLVVSRMLCNRHYLLWQKNGSPLIQKRRTAEPGASHTHPLYKTWGMIYQRCNNPNYTYYKNYGGRGIKMYPDWENSFVAFRDYVDENLGPKEEGMTLDRIDNSKGYIPGNIRWADHATQMHNRRTAAKSGVKGVDLRKDTGKWVARLKKNGVSLRKEFETLEEAAAQRKVWEKEYYGTQEG